MNLGRHTEQQLAGCRLLGVNSLLLALSKVVINSMLELGPQLRNRFSMK